MITFNIYVPSYHRSGSILTHHHLEYCTYVVRESEKHAYESTGVSVLAVDDSLIDSIPNVQNWIIENTPEDVVCIVDDDVFSFIYRLETNERIKSPEIVCCEIERLAQLLVDLDLGYCSVPNDKAPKFYDREFKFCGVTGQLRVVNKAKRKARFNDIDFLNDVDFELQELLHNRIILIPNYFLTDAGLDTNSGGSNDEKSLAKFYLANTLIQDKWGVYYVPSVKGKPGKLAVKR